MTQILLNSKDTLPPPPPPDLLNLAYEQNRFEIEVQYLISLSALSQEIIII